jgi:hypothetical protein
MEKDLYQRYVNFPCILVILHNSRNPKSLFTQFLPIRDMRIITVHPLTVHSHTLLNPWRAWSYVFRIREAELHAHWGSYICWMNIMKEENLKFWILENVNWLANVEYVVRYMWLVEWGSLSLGSERHIFGHYKPRTSKISHHLHIEFYSICEALYMQKLSFGSERQISRLFRSTPIK